MMHDARKISDERRKMILDERMGHELLEIGFGFVGSQDKKANACAR
jgi:hypothetical protein